MKRIILGLLFLSVVTLHASSEESALSVKTSDGATVSVPRGGIFPRLEYMVDNTPHFGKKNAWDVDLEADAATFQMVTDLYTKKNYSLPLNNNHILENGLYLLGFFGASRYKEKMYVAWLNSPLNKDKELICFDDKNEFLYEMGIDRDHVSETVSQTYMQLTQEEIQSVRNYKKRPVKNKTIAYLRATDTFPKASRNFSSDSLVLNLWNKNLCGVLTQKDFEGIRHSNRIQYLYLSENKLTDIKQGTFEDLEALEMLYLENNQLTEIEPGAFRGLGALEVLKLENNQLTDIKPGTFEDLGALQQLDLENNQLTDIKSGAFRGLGALFMLHLSENKLTDIKQGTFEDLEALQQLGLSKNKLTDIKTGAFRGLGALQLLNLDKNQLTGLKQEALTGCGMGLATVLFSDNKLTKEQIKSIKKQRPGLAILKFS